MNKFLFSRMIIVKTGEFEFKTNLYSNEFVIEVFMVFRFSQNLFYMEANSFGLKPLKKII